MAIIVKTFHKFLQTVFPCEFSKRGQRAFDHFRLHAVGDPHVPFHAEIVRGNEQQFVLFRPFAKGVGVFFGAFHKQIERAARIHAGKSAIGQAVIQKIAVAPIHA